MSTDIDIDLFQKLVLGQREAFDTLFRKYYQPLCRFANLFTYDSNDAEDAVQTAFIALWENKAEIKINQSVKAYLYQMVRNNALMILRKSNTRKQYEQQFADMLQDIPSEKILTDDQVNELVLKGLAMLPEKCRMIFSLSRYDGLTYEEIAEYLNIAPKTVENQMGIAFQKLREFLSPLWKKLLLTLGVIIFKFIS